MPRITISTELEQDLEDIKKQNYPLRYDRGFESTVIFLVKDYQQRQEITKQLIELRSTIIRSMEVAAEKGTKQALTKMIHNILSL